MHQTEQVCNKMSTTSRLPLLALAGLLLLGTFASCGCSCDDDDVHRRELADGGCQPSGTLRPSKSHSCEDCCKAGRSYPTYACSPPTSGSTKAIMTLNDFDEGGDGGDPSECDGQFHKNSERVVALSTGWYNGEAVAARTYGSAPTAGPCSPRSWTSATRSTGVTASTRSSRRADQRRRRVAGRVGQAGDHRGRRRRVRHHLV